MSTIFTGPQLSPPTISLLTAADIIPIENKKWETSFQLINDAPETFDISVIADCPNEPNEDDRESERTECTVEDYKPFILVATERVGTMDPRSSDIWDRAERKLLTAEAAVLEEQLWTAVHQSGNPFLADGAGAVNVAATTTVPMTATSAWEALALLEQAFSGSSATKGMIHARPQVIHELLRAQTIRRVGNVYLTPLDNIVVPGRGYPGTGPAAQAVGATEWMYGHPGIVQVRRSEVSRVGDGASTYIREWNERVVFVQRTVHVALDSALGVFAIEFNAIA